MKDLTHYFRPSSKSDEPGEGKLDGIKSISKIDFSEDPKTDDCIMYSSESDSDGDLATPKKKTHLIVQVPGVSVCKTSARKRKCQEVIPSRVKKSKTSQCVSPLRKQKINSENEYIEESFYMSPLRLDSDSSPEDSPSGKVSTSLRSPAGVSPRYRPSVKKHSLRITKNPFLNSAKLKNKNDIDCPKGAKNSHNDQKTLVRGKNEPMEEKETGGPLHKYFENVTSAKSGGKNSSENPKDSFIASDEDQLDVEFIGANKRTQKGGAELKIKAAAPKGSQLKKMALNASSGSSPKLTSHLLKSSPKSPTRTKILKEINSHSDQETPSTSTKKDSKVGPKIENDGLKVGTNNNILNYFDKTEVTRKSKKKRAKMKLDCGTELQNETAEASSISTCTSSKDKITVTECKGEQFHSKSPSASDNEGKTKDPCMEKSSSGKRNGECQASKKSSDTCSSLPSRDDTIDISSSLKLRERSLRRSGVMQLRNVSTAAVVNESEEPCQKIKGNHNIEKRKSSERLRTKLNRQSTKDGAVGESSKESEVPRKEEVSVSRVHQRSVNQCKAAAIVRRARQQPCLKQKIQRIRDPRIPSTSSSDEVIIVSEEIAGGETKEIIIRPSFVKLAPLFIAKEELQKKKIFLQSGAPDVVLRRIQQQKRMEVELEEASGFPCVSHTLQKDSSFPWCLDINPTLLHHLSQGQIDLHDEQERMINISSRKLRLGNISGLPCSLASMLIHLRPPIPSLVSPTGSPVMSPESDGFPHCFCVSMSPDASFDEKFQEYSSSDVEMFERVHAWLMRSLLPPGVAFKMCVDLSFFLPQSPSTEFLSEHIFAVPCNSSGPQLRKQMLFQLKEEYPTFPVNRRYKVFYQRKKSDGGLYLFTYPPAQEVVILDSSPPSSVNEQCSDKDASNGHSTVTTPGKLRRSRRKSNIQQSTPVAKVKETGDVTPDHGASSMLSINDTAVKASCSSLLTSECWTDIFAPESFSDACSLGRNLKTLEKLRSWLDSWTKKKTVKDTKRNRTGSDWSESEEEFSSGMEFCSSDDDEVKEAKNIPTNVAILIGPCGSGKTSSVYALAKELKYKVLEINASSKRSGKYILATVKEATRSYQVMSSGGMDSSFSIGSFFKKTTPNKISASPEKKAPKKCPKSSEKITSPKKPSSAMSLIFVEDVDVVFENEDEGFIGALTSLTTSTKRPVILEVHTSKPLRMGTTNNWLLEETLTEACPHLINFLAKQNRTPLILPFERSRNHLHAEALLRVACLSEGVWVSKQWSESLIKHTAGDFRRAIQEAQFWAGSVARSSIILDNLTRYPKEVTQKGDISPHRLANGHLASKLAPVNLCGCVERRACSYPYSWMHGDYIQHIWLKLDQIVDTAFQLMQDVVSPDIRSNAVSITPKAEQKEENNSPQKSPITDSQKTEISVDMPSQKIQSLSKLNGICKVEKPTPSPVRQSSRINKGSRQFFHSRNRRLQRKPEPAFPSSAKRRIEFKENSEEDIKQDIVKVEANDKLNSVLNEQKFRPSRSKTNLMIFSEYLDVLCTSDVFLKKFRDTGSLETGKNLVFEMGSITNLVELSMKVSTSDKGREMEVKQAKNSNTAAQYQMILPIVPNYWLLNCSALALDVAPHIRETCRILDELTKTGKSRTRLSHRLPTINRVGPTLREALCKTLVDDISTDVSPDSEVTSKEREIGE